jgi:hypothetical protein
VSLPPSRFGAGFTVGGAPATPAATAGPVVANVGGPPSVAAPAAHAAAPTPASGMNALAVLSFVSVLLLGPLIAVVSIPMALVARAQINRRGQGGSGLVIATLALGVIYLAFGVVVLLLYALTSGGGGTT